MTRTRYWLSLSNFEVDLALRSEKELILVGGYPEIFSKTSASKRDEETLETIKTEEDCTKMTKTRNEAEILLFNQYIRKNWIQGYNI